MRLIVLGIEVLSLLSLLNKLAMANHTLPSKYDSPESPLTLSLVMVNHTLLSMKIAEKSSQSLYISSVPQVEFVSPEYTVAEDAGEVDVCLMIDHNISSPIIVRLYAFPDTAEGMEHCTIGETCGVIIPDRVVIMCH